MADIQDLLRIGAINPNGGGGSGGANGLLPNVDFSRSFGLQGATPFAFVNANLQTPIAAALNNAPCNKPGQQNFLQKFAASCREDFDKIKQAGDQLVSAGAQSSTIQPGERIASGIAAPSSGSGIELA